MADEALTNEQVAEMRKKRTFRKFTFRGIDLDKLLDLSMEVCLYTVHKVKRATRRLFFVRVFFFCSLC